MRSSTKSQPRRVKLRTVGEPEPVRRPEAVPVIVELAGDGWVTVYGPRHVRPAIISRLVDDDGPPEVQAELATLADLFHELELPRLHRPFYWPVHVLATGRVCKRTPEGERLRQERLGFIREARSIRAELLAGRRVEVPA